MDKRITLLNRNDHSIDNNDNNNNNKTFDPKRSIIIPYIPDISQHEFM